MKKRSGFEIAARLIVLVKPLTGYMLLAILMGILGNLAAAFITICGGYAAANVAGIADTLPLYALFIIVCVLAIVRGFLRYAEQSCNHFIAFKLLALIRDKVFGALRRLCPAKLEGKDKGDLIAVITSDIELLEVFYAHTISPIAIAAIFSGIMCIYIGHFHWILGVIALAAYLAVGVCIPLWIARCGGDDGMRFRKKSGELSGFVLDSLRGLGEILQYGQGEKRLAAMNEKTAAMSEEERKLKYTAGKNQAVTNTTILVFDLVMLFAAALLNNSGQIGFPAMLFAVIALMSSYGPVVALANLGSTLQNTFAAGNRVLDILDEEPVTEEISGNPEVAFAGAQAQNVTFSYDQETILQDVSVDIQKGTVIGITGRSGSGKSTLLKLLMRFWKADKGSVRISDTDVEQINTKNLRDMESFVTQETHLFHDSIRNNLRVAKWDATEEELVSACKKASIHDWIESLPSGYDTPVGELGDTLSGGERQRIGLARAFLHDADLMLLDEPTSNLDSLNEAVILKSLREEKENRTVVLVSHRLSTMRIADKIYSVEHGRVS